MEMENDVWESDKNLMLHTQTANHETTKTTPFEISLPTVPNDIRMLDAEIM